MTNTIYGITEEELMRLICAYIAIRKPEIRGEFLQTLENWAQDQWLAATSPNN